MMDTKQTTELLRAASAVMVDVLDSMEDGKRTFAENLKALGLIPVVMAGIKGISEVKGELQDLDEAEKSTLILEIRDMLLRSKKLSYRAADIAADILHLVSYNVNAISWMLKRPPTAELVEETEETS